MRIMHTRSAMWCGEWGKVTREARPMKHGTTVIPLVGDPDGDRIEFIQRTVA